MAYYLLKQGKKGTRIDLFFESNPGDSIRTELKNEGWHYMRSARCWYNYKSQEHIEQAQEFVDIYNGDDAVDSCQYASSQPSNVMTVVKTIDSKYDYLDRIEFDDWEEESILHQCGYNVSQKDGYSDEWRQNLLKAIIEKNILTKERVIDFLKAMINTRSGKPHLSEAVAKWERDLAFVKKL